MKILIGIPSKDRIEIETAISIANLDWDGHVVTYTHSDGAGVYGVAQARNRLVDKALEGGYDYLFMVDADMVLPEDAIINLLDPPVQIVTGCARYKNDSRRTPLFKATQDSEGSNAWKWDEIPPRRFEVESGGVACAMIDVNLFRKFSRPWFVWEERNDGTYCGEDIGFYDQLHQAGIKTYADGRVKCGHIGRKTYD